MYRQEFVQAFEQRQSLLRGGVTTDGILTGNSFVFLVAGSGGATAQTRGVDGLIQARSDANDQYTLTLAEWHDLVRKTSFNVFASQGDQRRIMQETTMSVINRKVDQDILAALANTTLTTGALGVKASLNLVAKACTILGNNDVPMDGGLFGAITPAFYWYLMQTTEFASADFTNTKKFDNGVPVNFDWAGVHFIVAQNLVGKGTTAETCYFWHKTAIGHGVNTQGIQSPVGYNEEQDYSWARCSVFMGSKLLQNAGIVKVVHDGSEYVSG
jgi:hypothetical protein